MEEEKEEQSEEEIVKSKKKRGKGLILIIVVAVAVLLGGGGAFFFLTKSGGDKGPKKGEATAKEEAAMFSLDPFVVNLSDQGANKFLKVSMQLELSSQAAMESAKTKTPQLRDAVINLLTSKTSDTLMSPEGKLQLKDEINMMANQILGNNTVKNVYLTEFVMQ
ncbi:MAG: flagellar basal body-associated FliL family protein [Nitrospirae bacterium]|nr:flagellar basal body-associated FliL family protein [Nitrospirota bacterium]